MITDIVDEWQNLDMNENASGDALIKNEHSTPRRNRIADMGATACRVRSHNRVVDDVTSMKSVFFFFLCILSIPYSVSSVFVVKSYNHTKAYSQ